MTEWNTSVDGVMVWPEGAVALLDAIEDISQDHYCAGWMSDIEFDLWRFITADPLVPAEYGLDDIPVAKLEALRVLSQKIGGWMYWDDSTDCWDNPWRFATTEQWTRMFNEREERLRKAELERFIKATL